MNELQLKIIEENSDKFNLFYDYFIETNEKFNLTSITNKEDVFNKHFLDSLIPIEEFKNNSKVVEIGSGGGFPSIPLKIANNTLFMTLIESSHKKCDYLRELAKKLNLKNIEVYSERCEDLAKNSKFREKYDYAIARAVAPLPTLLEYLAPFLKVGGKIIALKIKSLEELEISKNALKILNLEIEKTIEYKIDEETERVVYIIKKLKKTDLKYPRGNGKERKNPL